MAELGISRAVGLAEEKTCDMAIANAYEGYNIFRINPSCACKIVDAKAWHCELYFHYSSKKNQTED